MEILKRLRQWLISYPKWDEGALTYIDFTDGMPGSSALCPQGMEEISRVQDVTGNTTVGCRWNFALYRVGQRRDDNHSDAVWLMDFQQWVQEQSATGQAPAFGDDPTRERICARKGKLHKTNAAGTVSYCVELSVEFIRYFEKVAEQ